MFRFMDGIPPNVLAIEATGKVTHEDYHDTLIPRIEAMLVKGPVRMLYGIGKEFKGFGLEALWDDGTLGSSTGTISATLRSSPIRPGCAPQ